MISDKAVEAAARAINADRWQAHMDVAREALQAALPVLLEGKAEKIARVIDPSAFRPDGDATSRDLDHDHPKGIAVARDERRQNRVRANRIIDAL